MTKVQVGGGSPSFCWHCMKQLRRAPGKGLGLFYFELVLGEDGVEHRVHQSVCARSAVAEGAKLLKEAK